LSRCEADEAGSIRLLIINPSIKGSAGFSGCLTGSCGFSVTSVFFCSGYYLFLLKVLYIQSSISGCSSLVSLGLCGLLFYFYSMILKSKDPFKPWEAAVSALSPLPISHSSTSLLCPIIISVCCYFLRRFKTPGIRFLWASTKLSLANTGLLDPLSSLLSGLCLFWGPEAIVKFCLLSYVVFSFGLFPIDFFSGSSVV